MGYKQVGVYKLAIKNTFPICTIFNHCQSPQCQLPSPYVIFPDWSLITRLSITIVCPYIIWIRLGSLLLLFPHLCHFLWETFAILIDMLSIWIRIPHSSLLIDLQSKKTTRWNWNQLKNYNRSCSLMARGRQFRMPSQGVTCKTRSSRRRLFPRWSHSGNLSPPSVLQCLFYHA